MPRHHAFWVIVAGTTPTAFRARRAEDLLPTLRQLQRTQPDTVLRWFDRGRLWESPSAERDALRSQRQTRPVRKPDWRPGGAHADPRARFKQTRDQKRARFKQRLGRDRRGQIASTQGSAPVDSRRTSTPKKNPRRPWRGSSGQKRKGPRPPGPKRSS